MKIEIYDTTLRDGAQMKGIYFSLIDKLKIVQKLDDFEIDYIEGGWPGSNPKDKDFFREVLKLKLKKAQIVAFSMTCRKGFNPKYDSNLQELLKTGASTVTLVGKSWKSQVEKVLRVSLKENLRLIKESCAFFNRHKRQVFYDAEHFFDGFKEDSEYALETIKAAVFGGAIKIILCDTNGGTLPWEIDRIIEEVKKVINLPLGIHAHNDGGLAVANTLVAIKQGVSQVQGTINGYGERCGNADLCSVIPNLQLKMGFDCLSPEKLAKLVGLSHYVSEIANLKPNFFQPFVGENAFIHKGGMHGDAQSKWEMSYQHINPVLVGNHSQIAVSELSGKANISIKARDFGIELSPTEILETLRQIKNLENQGFQFEGAEASLTVLMQRMKLDYQPPFEILSSKVLEEFEKQNSLIKSRAVVKLRVKDKIICTNAEGNGPINALDKAIRGALLSVYSQFEKVHLTDYKVRILNEKAGTAARVRVLIDSAFDGYTWTTVGSSTDIIEASLQAIGDSLEYAFLIFNKKF